MSLKNISIKALSKISEIFNADFLIKQTSVKTIFPFWHIISDNAPIHIKHLYQIKSVKEFKSDIDFLLKYFKPVSFNKYIDREKKSGRKEMVFSFDDGLKECSEIIAPILIEKGIPAIFFINSDFVDNKALFYKYKLSIIVDKIINSDLSKINKIYTTKKILALSYNQEKTIDEIAAKNGINFQEYLKNKKPYMSLKELKLLKSQGFTIGAHSQNHPLYSQINIKEQISQTKNSLNFVDENFNQKLKLFAFPFTDFGISDKFFETVYKQGIADYTFGTAGLKTDYFKHNIQRIAMEKNSFTAEKNIKTMYIAHKIKNIINQNIAKR